MTHTLTNLHKAVTISGLLHFLGDNILPFLDKETDVFVHTWDIGDNRRWLYKLNRYKKYCNSIKVIIDQPKFEKKLHSYFYSTYRAVNMMQDISKYDKIIKFKPNLDGDVKYVGDLEYYFHKAYIQSRPLLEGIKKEDCLYGPIYYKTMDERLFSGYPLAFQKAFHILEDKLVSEVLELDNILTEKYGPTYEGSIFWKDWLESKGVTLIHDIDLILPNNKN